MSEELDSRSFCPACGAMPGMECHEICQSMRKDDEMEQLKSRLLAANATIERMREVLQEAGHELTTLHGLSATDLSLSRAEVRDFWTIDTKAVNARIDAALTPMVSNPPHLPAMLPARPRRKEMSEEAENDHAIDVAIAFKNKMAGPADASTNGDVIVRLFDMLARRNKENAHLTAEVERLKMRLMGAEADVFVGAKIDTAEVTAFVEKLNAENATLREELAAAKKEAALNKSQWDRYYEDFTKETLARWNDSESARAKLAAMEKEMDAKENTRDQLSLSLNKALKEKFGMEKVVEAAKNLDALWVKAEVCIGPTELALHAALASVEAVPEPCRHSTCTGMHDSAGRHRQPEPKVAEEPCCSCGSLCEKPGCGQICGCKPEPKDNSAPSKPKEGGR